MMKVSIIMAAYNAAGTIAAALSSIPLAVSCDYEVLVCDDGSTDDTAGIVARHAIASKCMVLKGENAGPSTARNRGLAAATGDTVLFFDADDELVPHAIDRLLAAMKPVDVAAYGNFVNIDAAGNVLPRPWWATLLLSRPQGNVLSFILQANFVVVGSILIRRDILQQVGGFNAVLRFGEDWELWCRVAGAGTFAYAGNEPPVLRYRRHAQSSTQTMNDITIMAAPTLGAVFNNTNVVKQFNEQERTRLYRSQEAHMLHLQAIREARLGRWNSAWKQLGQAMYHCPHRAVILLLRFLANVMRVG